MNNTARVIAVCSPVPEIRAEEETQEDIEAQHLGAICSWCYRLVSFHNQIRLDKKPCLSLKIIF